MTSRVDRFAEWWNARFDRLLDRITPTEWTWPWIVFATIVGGILLFLLGTELFYGYRNAP